MSLVAVTFIKMPKCNGGYPTTHARVAVLPARYIAVLPAGYRVVTGDYYLAGGIRYRATFYQGRTVYIRL